VKKEGKIEEFLKTVRRAHLNGVPLSLARTKAETDYPDVVNFPSSEIYPIVRIMQNSAKRKEMGKKWEKR
jgi:hypothetical protein